jgi:hypothetical protein
MAMELARVGAEVTLLSGPDHPAKVVRSLSGRQTYRATRPLRSLRRAIEASRADLVVPCDERAVRHLHRLQAQEAGSPVGEVIERSIGAPDGYPFATSRHDLLMLAKRHGVRVPASSELASVADLDAWGEQHEFPWVLKADGSWAGFGVRVVRSLEEARRAYHEMIRPPEAWLALREAVLDRDMFWIAPWLKRQRPSMSVQSYVDGWPSNCAVACWQGEVLAGICAESVTTASATGPSTIARVIDNPDMLEAARRVVGVLRCSGLLGFDFMLEAATGAPFMIEMNPRVTPIATVRLGLGKDLPEALIARASARPAVDHPAVTERDLIAYFPHTWRHDPTSPLLQTSYHDVPWEEPELVHMLVRPELRDRYWYTRALRRMLLSYRSRRGTGRDA